MVKLGQLEEALNKACRPEQYPCTVGVEHYFVDNPAISGQRVLIAMPLYINSLTAILPWLRAGADVTVTWPKELAPGEGVVELLKECGVDCRHDITETELFDVVLDCTGDHIDIPSRCGYVELTKSGATKYEQHKELVCIDVDASPVKEMETFLGTADGLLRALDQQNLGDLEGKPCLLFGFGKVGRGVAKGLLQRGADLKIVEFPGRYVSGHSLSFVDCRDKNVVHEAVKPSHLVVTVTGVKGLITSCYSPDVFVQSNAILVNMGAEDEYGSGVPKERVENAGVPLNFSLKEPTDMKYLDPTMALYTLSGVLLLDSKLSGTFAPGRHMPPEKFTSEILDCFYARNQISPDMLDAIRAGDVLS